MWRLDRGWGGCKPSKRLHQRVVHSSAVLSGIASERLESRLLLSACAVGEPAPADIATVASGAVAHQGHRRSLINLTGQFDIPTEFGTAKVTSVQHGKKLKGQVDLSAIDLGQLLNSPTPLPIPISLPPIQFKGKFKDLTLDIDFQTKVSLPIVGLPLFTVTGNVTAHVELGTGLVGHLTVSAAGHQVLSTDFTTPLPKLP